MPRQSRRRRASTSRAAASTAPNRPRRRPSTPVAGPRLPRGLTSNPTMPFEEALLACMDAPAVLVRTSAGRTQSWVIATGTMQRWGLLSDRSGTSDAWRRDGAQLGRATDPAVRARLIRARREMLTSNLPNLAWQEYPLTEAFGRVPSGMSVEAVAACLWWLHQRSTGATTQAASMLLNLTLDPFSAARFVVDENGSLRWQGAEVRYSVGRIALRAANRGAGSGGSGRSAGRTSAAARRATGSSR